MHHTCPITFGPTSTRLVRRFYRDAEMPQTPESPSLTTPTRPLSTNLLRTPTPSTFAPRKAPTGLTGPQSLKVAKRTPINHTFTCSFYLFQQDWNQIDDQGRYHGFQYRSVGVAKGEFVRGRNFKDRIGKIPHSDYLAQRFGC